MTTPFEQLAVLVQEQEPNMPAIFDLCVEFFDSDEEEYIATWIPYLEENAPFMKEDVFPIAMEFLCMSATRLFPFAKFAVEMTDLVAVPELEQVQSIDFWGVQDLKGFKEFINSPYLANLKDLSFLEIPLTTKVLSTLATSEIASHLTTLSFVGGVGDKELGALLEGNTLTGLKSFLLYNTKVSDKGLRIVSEASCLSNLEELVVSTDEVSRDVSYKGIKALKKASFVENLTFLDMSGYTMGDRAIKTLAKVEASNLKQLQLLSIRLGDEGFEALMNSPLSYELQALSVGQNELTGKSFASLAQSSGLANLEMLDMQSNQLAGGVDALENAKFISGLTEFGLGNNSLDAESAKTLAGLDFEKLKGLSLTLNPIGSEGAAAIFAASWFAGLESLELASCELDDASLKALVEQGSELALTELTLADNQITDEGAKLLAGVKSFEKLHKFDLSNNQVTKAGVDVLCSSEHLGHLTQETIDLDDPVVQQLVAQFQGMLGEEFDPADMMGPANADGFVDHLVLSVQADI